MENKTQKIIELLKKWNKLYNNNADDLVSYYIEYVKDYVKSENPNYYRELFTILDDNVFSLKCYCGLVYCCIEFNKDIAGATFENMQTNESVFATNQYKQNKKDIESKMFEIFD